MGGIPHARGGVLDIFIYPPLRISYPQVVSVDKYLSSDYKEVDKMWMDSE